MPCIQADEAEFGYEVAIRKNAIELQRRIRMGEFFRSRRIDASIEIDAVASALEFDDQDRVRQIEAGEVAIPIEDVFVLTNVLNIPPDDVALLIQDLYSKT